MSEFRRAPEKYSQDDQQELRNELDRRNLNTHKRDRHLECLKGTGIILTDTATGTRYLATIASGAWVLTALA